MVIALSVAAEWRELHLVEVIGLVGDEMRETWRAAGVSVRDHLAIMLAQRQAVIDAWPPSPRVWAVRPQRGQA
jgi:hypothetical protein